MSFHRYVLPLIRYLCQSYEMSLIRYRPNIPHSPAHIKLTLIIWLYSESFKVKDFMLFLLIFFVPPFNHSGIQDKEYLF